MEINGRLYALVWAEYELEKGPTYIFDKGNELMGND